MSLQVWLPLNGDLHNQGLKNIKPVGNGVILDTNGKIGSCYSFNGSNSISINAVVLPSQTPAWSFTCWFYLSDTTMTTASCFFSERIGTNSTGYTIFIYPKTGKILVDDGMRWEITPQTFTQNTWYHLAITRNSSGKKLYINGELKGSTSTIGNTTTVNTNGCLIGLAQSSSALATGNQGIKGKLNDIRIYNHCLSQKEIKEISKGLILHYQLNRNIYSKYDKNIYIEPDGSHWIHIVHHNNPKAGLFSQTDNWTLGIKKDNNIWFHISIINLLNSFEFMVKQKTTSSATEVKYRWIQTVNPLKAVYNDVKPASVTRITTEGYTDGTFGGLWKTNNKTYLCIANNSSSSWYGALGCWTAYQGGIPGYPTTIITSGYIDLYVRVDELFNKIYDCSGYNNNGIINGNLSISSLSPKNNNTLLFNGIDACIKVPYNQINPSGIFTLNLWFKKDGLGSKGYETLFGGPSGFEMDTRSGSSSTLSLYMASTHGGNVFSPFNLGQWYMVTMVRNGTNELYYVNGELKKTIEAKSMPTGDYFIGAWKTSTSQNYKGNISDFRLYATALSADNIKELYRNSKIINGENKFPRNLE